jgi:hypothetical protein
MAVLLRQQHSSFGCCQGLSQQHARTKRVKDAVHCAVQHRCHILWITVTSQCRQQRCCVRTCFSDSSAVMVSFAFSGEAADMLSFSL